MHTEYKQEQMILAFLQMINSATEKGVGNNRPT